MNRGGAVLGGGERDVGLHVQICRLAATKKPEAPPGYWLNLNVAGTKYNVPRMPPDPSELFSWERFRPAVARAVAIARGTTTVDTPPRSIPVSEPKRSTRLCAAAPRFKTLNDS